MAKPDSHSHSLHSHDHGHHHPHELTPARVPAKQVGVEPSASWLLRSAMQRVAGAFLVGGSVLLALYWAMIGPE